MQCRSKFVNPNWFYSSFFRTEFIFILNRKILKILPTELLRFLFIVHNFLMVWKKNCLHTPAIPLFFFLFRSQFKYFSCPNFFFGPIFSSVSTSFIMYFILILFSSSWNIYNCFILEFYTTNIFIADNLLILLTGLFFHWEQEKSFFFSFLIK